MNSMKVRTKVLEEYRKVVWAKRTWRIKRECN